MNGRTPGEGDAGYDEWQCAECGHGHPKNSPPCDRCGNLKLTRVHVRAGDFDDEIAGIGTLALVRENLHLVLAAVVVVTTVGGVIATGSGLFVLSDPFGWGYKWGEVAATEPTDDDAFSAGDLRTELETDLAVDSLAWRGERLELSYRTEAETSAQYRSELETIATAFARYVDDGGEADRLTVVVTEGGGRVGELTVERRWAVAFNAGELSADEYLQRIADSQRR